MFVVILVHTYKWSKQKNKTSCEPFTHQVNWSYSVSFRFCSSPCPTVRSPLGLQVVSLQLIDLTFDLFLSVQLFCRFSCCWCFSSIPLLQLLCPDLGLPASCCGIPEAPGTRLLLPLQPHLHRKAPRLLPNTSTDSSFAQMRWEAPRGFAPLPPQASEIPEIPECGRCWSALIWWWEDQTTPGHALFKSNHVLDTDFYLL